ncbi:MAG: type II secretion system protein [Candidatus Omnitrophota bacterium]
MRKAAIKSKGFTIGEVLIVFVVVSAMILVSMPFLKQVIIRRDKVICAGNLRELGLALYIYAREHEGRFPGKVKTLYDEGYLSDEKLLDCPSTRETGSLESPDYIYAAGLTIKSPSQEALVWDKAKNHEGKGRNVLYLNGVVAWEEEHD